VEIPLRVFKKKEGWKPTKKSRFASPKSLLLFPFPKGEKRREKLVLP
jgi:hypothetical protein